MEQCISFGIDNPPGSAGGRSRSRGHTPSPRGRKPGKAMSNPSQPADPVDVARVTIADLEASDVARVEAFEANLEAQRNTNEELVAETAAYKLNGIRAEASAQAMLEECPRQGHFNTL